MKTTPKKRRKFLLYLTLIITLTISAQDITVRGRVTDTNNTPIIGAKVIVKDNKLKGTTTNIDGEYTLNNIPSNSVLIINFIGMETQTIDVSGRTVLNIVLKEDSKDLEEVIVIGYGTTRKSDLTGSIAQVQPKELTLAPVSSFEDALAGRMAGVRVSSTDGQPGSLNKIVIRGANSLTQDNSPLFIIDGIAIEDPDNAAINPEEIATMNVLKDASATAIYGARAANGVIIIETKKGVSAKPIVSFNTSIGFQSPIKLIPMMEPYDFVKTQLEINKILAQSIYTTAELPENHERYDPNGRTLEDYKDIEGYDWQKMALNTAPIQNYNLSVRGRNASTSYAISGSIHDQNGIVLNTGFTRYQGRLNLTQQINKKTNAGIYLNYTQNLRHGQIVNEGGGAGYTAFLLYRVWAYRPVAGVPGLDLTEYSGDPENVNIGDIRLNPIISSKNEYNKLFSTVFSASTNIDYNIMPDLTLRVRGSYYTNRGKNERFYNKNTPQGSPLNYQSSKGVYGTISFSDFNSLLNENTLTFNKTYNKVHKINLVGGMTYQYVNNSRFGYSSQNIDNDFLYIYGLDEGTPFEPIANGGENVLLSYFGRADYNFNSRYMITATFRADASSKFAKNNRWGYFPSVAVAWNMKEEKFLKDIELISNSKLRISYGETGNNRVGNYDYLKHMSKSIYASYSFNNATPIQGIIPTNIENTSLRWETTKQTNIGYDFGMMRNRIELTMDWYKKVTRDLLLFADMPATSGTTRAFKNIGSISNTGLEFALKTINVSTPKFSWTSNFNISFNENKIIALTRDQNKYFTLVNVPGATTPLYVSRIGVPAGMFYGYIFDGIYQIEDFNNPAEGVYILKPDLPDNGTQRSTIQPGHIKYKDLNNDGTINTQDMAVIGRGQPLHFGGFTNNFYYNGFSFSAFFQWSYGNKIYNANRYMFDGNGLMLFGLNSYATYKNRWTPENRSNTHFIPTGNGPIGYQSTRVLEDGSYLRLKTLSLGYSLPNKVIKRLSISELVFRMAFQNLITWTKYSGMDPEVSVLYNQVLSPGYDYSAYPQARTTTFGISLTL